MAASTLLQYPRAYVGVSGRYDNDGSRHDAAISSVLGH
jgi:hypothetical protein